MTYIDSGYVGVLKAANRPGLQALLSDAKKGRFTY
jgi:DNA invertase Pin-like site-specific DNA recombinase